MNDVMIVGGSIIGVATVDVLMQRNSGRHLLFLEMEERVAAHQTERKRHHPLRRLPQSRQLQGNGVPSLDTGGIAPSSAATASLEIGKHIGSLVSNHQ